ncbi:bifunctional serine/threonine-protein kinase/formylglycine-generating enzyme family protein [Aeoliella sp.]|uniref:bifunctional serine/threonine-protein kinase/formylglycine-generating enzyme family protein n=1 Tax=Aeoliella sp. TaxID=2795800 RepID=UPI003CCB80E6
MANEENDTKRGREADWESLEQVYSRYEHALRAGNAEPIADIIARCKPEQRPQVLEELLLIEIELREKAGDPLTKDRYLRELPEYDAIIRDVFDRTVAHRPAAAYPPIARQLQARCTECQQSFGLATDADLSRIVCPTCHKTFQLVGSTNNEDPQSGVIIELGHFRLLSRLGKGGFGSVWKASDTKLHRLVAVKIPAPGQLGPDEAERFLREARAAAQLSHPNIVPVHEVGRENDTLYIVSELIQGATLAEQIAKSKLSRNDAVQLTAKVARALDYAHQCGIIHRDVKPHNVMVDLDGQPRLTDFGLAKWEQADATMTLDGHIMGTPGYLSPEQARGESGKVDGRTDVYSLGAMLFQLITGELLYSGSPQMMLHQAIVDEAPSPRRRDASIPRDLETIVLKCLERDPGKRYESAGSLASDLECFLANKPISARPVGIVEWWQRWCQRHPVEAILGSVLAASVVVGMTLVIYQWLATLRAEHDRTTAQVLGLTSADATAVPELLQYLEPYVPAATNQLEDLAGGSDVSARERLRAMLPLLGERPQYLDSMVNLALEAELGDVLLVRQAALDAQVTLRPIVKPALDDVATPEGQRVRAAALMAEDQEDALQSHRNWLAEAILDKLVTQPQDYAVLGTLFEPAAEVLAGPFGEIYRDPSRSQSERTQATNFLVDYLAPDPESRLRLLDAAESWQFASVYRTLDSSDIIAWAQSPIHDSSAGEHASRPDNQAIAEANRAIALIRSGRTESGLNLLLESDAGARAQFVNRYREIGGEPSPIASLLTTLDDECLCSVLLLTLSRFPAEELGQAIRDKLVERAEGAYHYDTSAHVHAAARVVLLRYEPQLLEQPLPTELVGWRSRSEHNWYATPHDHTMVLLEADPQTIRLEPTTGDATPDKRERNLQNPGQKEKRILAESPHRFAIASCETTVSQYRRFATWSSLGYDIDDPDAPAYFMNWSLAARYCNWLSQEAGLPEEEWAYVPTTSGERLTEAPDAIHRLGYRLPTELEWEVACRAGTTSPRFFGFGIELLPQYAAVPANSPLGRKHLVGRHLPNEFGLFDTYGNADELCHGIEDGSVYTRGGAAGDIIVPSSAMWNYAEVYKDPGLAIGFRIARTLAEDE